MIRSSLLLIASLLAAAPACAREQIRAVGSSTVYPFAAAAAEAFGQAGAFRTPIVEATGTGGGFKLFCAGLGDAYPDINDASRPITESEVELCHKNGVTGIAELAIGYDGIVIANSTKSPRLDVSKQELFLALARDIPKDGKLIRNPYTHWRQIHSRLPDQPILIYGPPPTSGTRDAFVELVMEKGCESIRDYARLLPDEKLRKAACKALREDGVFVEAGEDDNLVIQKLQSNPHAFGIVGYNFLEENKEKIQASAIGGVAPDYKHIEDGSYGISRSLYMYLKTQHIGHVPGLGEFARELVSTGAIGPDGYLVERGLLPLHPAALKASQAVANKLGSATAP